MRRWAIGMRLAGAVLAAAAVGCQRDRPQEQVKDPDPAVDPPPTNLVAVPPADLLADQAALAREAAAAVSAAAPASAPASGPGTQDPNVVAVKQVMAKFLEAAKTGGAAQLGAFFRAEDANAAQVFSAMAGLPKKLVEFEALVKERLAMTEVPALIRQAAEGGAGGAAPTDLTRATPDTFQYKPEAGKVTVTAEGVKLVFARSDGQWKIELDAGTRGFLPVLGELIAAQDKFLTALSEGIKDGAISKENIDQKGVELAEGLIKPVGKKLADVMASVLGQALKGAASAPATAPAAPEAPEAPAP